MSRVSQIKRERALTAYFEGGQEPRAIAEALGLKEGTVLALLDDPDALEGYRKRSEAAKLRAQIRLNESAEAAARVQARLMHGEESEGTSTISHRAAKDILDRAGVRVPKETRSDVTVTFAGGAPELGMPEHAPDD